MSRSIEIPPRYNLNCSSSSLMKAVIIAPSGQGKSTYVSNRYPYATDGDWIIKTTAGWPLDPRWWDNVTELPLNVSLLNWGLISHACVSPDRAILFNPGARLIHLLIGSEDLEHFLAPLAAVVYNEEQLRENLARRAEEPSPTQPTDVEAALEEARDYLRLALWLGLPIFSDFSEAVRFVNAELDAARPPMETSE